MICHEKGTDQSVLKQGILFLNTETGFCEVISPCLQNLINPDSDFLNSIPLEDILEPKEEIEFSKFLQTMERNVADQVCYSFPARLRTRNSVVDCFVTAIQNPHKNKSGCDYLTLFVQIANQSESTQIKSPVEKTKEDWNKIGSHVHKLNNHLTALYCQWDLISQDILTTEENSQLIEDISETLKFFSQELRNLGSFIHSKMENQSFH